MKKQDDRLTYENLYQLYVIEQRGVIGTARALHCRNTTVHQKLRDLGFIGKVTKAWMEEEYVVKERSVEDIASELKVTEMMVRWYLRSFHISIRYKTRGSVRLPTLHDHEWLNEQYHDLGRSANDIATLIGCSPGSVYLALRRLGIPRRHAGHSFVERNNPYTVSGHLCFTQIQRKKVLLRDGSQCRMPGCDGSSKRLQVHHIIPRYNGGTNSPDNGITICRKCHYKTYGKEDLYEPMFLALIQGPLA